MAGLKTTFSESQKTPTDNGAGNGISTVTDIGKKPTIDNTSTYTLPNNTTPPRESKLSAFWNGLGNNAKKEPNTDKNQTYTGELQNSTYYPSQSLSPVQYRGVQGKYFAELPHISGGQILYPAGLEDARNKAINDQQLALDAKKQAVLTNYAMLKGKPAYQEHLNDYYISSINSQLDNIYDKYGEEGAIDILGDPTNPLTLNLNASYKKYEALTQATMDATTAITDAKTAMQNGKVLPQSAQDFIFKFYSGNATDAELLAFPSVLQTYNSLATTGASDMIKNKINGQTQEYFKNGIDTNNDGVADVFSNDGNKFITAITTQLNDDKTLDELTHAVLMDENLNPDYAYHPDIVKQYIKDIFPTFIKQSINTLSGNSGTNIYNDMTNKPIQYPILDETTTISTNIKYADGKVRPGSLTSLNGVTLPADKQSQIDLNNETINKYQANTGIPKVGTTKGNLIGVYGFAVNSAGQPTNADSKDAVRNADGSIMYDYFARVYVPPTATDNNTQSSDKISVTGTNSSATGKGSYMMVPFDEAIQQQAQLIALPTNPTISGTYVYVKDTGTNQKKTPLTQSKVPDPPSKN